jgi:hypothetical protein
MPVNFHLLKAWSSQLKKKLKKILLIYYVLDLIGEGILYRFDQEKELKR